ncbi:MAG: hypothetical protein HOM34_07885 [Planctomycetes bacterium]|jgi:hypothetical protein|nr:hypothetical protein [Planctomycetota bacterium]MBT4027889.1 hypothetical protein [Planctomycetota bacterium]MBT4560004.1 hypothetical protein [Planctomycetota bacterium]MBT5100781.1 hypothetical protein [Planctomycetota bacterium]MBT5120624.1 hypothetical protein [Planctomycetota bacterium]
MTRNRAPLWVIGLFLAQILFAGAHIFEHAELAHDCAHHDSSGFGGTGAADYELESHLDCPYCNLTRSHSALLDEATLLSSSAESFGVSFTSQVDCHPIAWQSAHPLRGPPVFV